MTGQTVAGEKGRRWVTAKETMMSGRAQGAAASPELPHATERGPRRSITQVAKDIVLFFAAPAITMAYLAMFPFIAVWLLRQARRERKAAG
jgi:hypothetical protein